MYLKWSFMYLVFTCMPGGSYRRRLRSLLSYLCYVFRALILILFGFKQSLFIYRNHKFNKQQQIQETQKQYDYVSVTLLLSAPSNTTGHRLHTSEMQKSSSHFWTATQHDQQQRTQQRDTASHVNPLDKTTE